MLCSKKINPCVLVTRPSPQGEILCEKIRSEGMCSIFFPTIEFVSLSFSSQLTEMNQCDWWIFISPQAVYQVQHVTTHSIKIAAIGAGTAQALQAQGWSVDAYPRDEWNSEGLLALPEFQQVAGKKIAIIKGEGGREWLMNELIARGANVMSVNTYRRELPKYDNPTEWLHKYDINMIVCSSNQGLENLLLLCKDASTLLQVIPVLVVSHRMQARAKELGFQHVIVAKNASHNAILEAIEKGKNMSHSSSPPLEKKPEKKRKFSWNLFGIWFSVSGVIVLLGLFIAANYFYLKLFQSDAAKAADHSMYLQNKQRTLERQVQDIQHQAQQQEQSLNALHHHAQQQEQSLNALRQAQTNEKREEWRLVEAGFLVKLANIKLQFENNIPQAIQLLQNADAEIRDLNQERLLSIRQALANNIASLQGVAVVDVTGIYMRLSALNEQVNHLPLINNRPNNDPVLKTIEEKLPWWKNGLQQTWQALQKIVVVRYHEKGVPPLVTPDQKEFIYQNLHAVLEKAIWGLLHNNTEIYQGSLHQAREWVKQYYLADSTVTQNVLSQLDELQKINIHPELPKLTESLDALQPYMK